MKQLLMIAAVAVLSMLSAAEPRNLFSNSGFEKWGTDGNYPGDAKWRWIFPPAKSPFTVLEQSSAEKHSGKYSLHLKDDDKSPVNHTLGFSFAPAELKKMSGKILTFSAWVKQASASSHNVVGLGIWGINGDTNKAFAASIGIPSTTAQDWTLLTQKVRLPANTKQLILYFRCANGWGNRGEAWFDDVTVTVTDDPSTIKAADVQKKN